MLVGLLGAAGAEGAAPGTALGAARPAAVAAGRPIDRAPSAAPWSRVALEGVAQTVDQEGPRQEPPFFDYELRETWSDLPWQPKAGHFVSVSDTSTAPDGKTWVLDGRGGALHVLDAAGRPQRRVILPTELLEEDWRPHRMDAAPNGLLAVLAAGRDAQGEPRSRVVLVDGIGRAVAAFDQPLAYRDIAAGREGRLYLVRTVPREPPPPSREPRPRPAGGLDVYDASGLLLAGAGHPPLYLPVAVDAADTAVGERIYVSNWLPSPAGRQPPEPAPTPRPSSMDPALLPPPRLLGGAVPAQATGDDPATTEGVVVLDPELGLRDFFPFYAPEDVGAGPAGLFVVRASELWRLTRGVGRGEPSGGDPTAPSTRELPTEPLWSMPTSQISIPSYGPIMTLDLPPNGAPGSGSLRVGLDHCQLRSMARFPASTLRADGPVAPQGFVGRTDRPQRAGPFYPLRAASNGAQAVALLQGRYTLDDPREPALPVEVGDWGAEPQGVQLWRSGAPRAQVALCGDEPNWFERRHDARWALDVAADGDVIYSAGPELLRSRSTDPQRPLPLWSWWAGSAAPDPAPPSPGQDEPPVAFESTPRIAAIDAHAGRIAVLDAGRGLLSLLDSQATLLASWPLEGLLHPTDPGPDPTSDPRPVSIPVDIAIDADRLVLGLPEGYVVVLDISGLRGDAAPPVVARWRTWDSPWRLAIGPTGDVFLLSRGAWVARYSSEGQQRALWRLPTGRPPTTADLTVLADGSVVVTYARAALPEEEDVVTLPAPGAALEPDWLIGEAGLWRFEPRPREVPPAFFGKDGCWVATDKRAAPEVVRVGEAVTVTLSVRPGCPELAPPLDLALVVDASRSMNWDGVLERAQRLLLELLGGLPATTRVRVMAFDAAPRLLAADVSPSRAAIEIAALGADGDTQLGAALAALGDWPSPAGRPTPTPAPGGMGAPAMRHVLLLVTDGELKDHPQAQADALRAQGVEISVLALPHPTFDGLRRRSLGQLAGDPSRVWVDLDAARIPALRAALTATSRGVPKGTLEIQDSLPEDMAFVLDSASPVATWRAGRRELLWPPIAAAESMSWTLRVRPQQVGLRPTNTVARGTWALADGEEVELGFPLPRVKVWDRSTLTHRAWLPAAGRGVCLRRTPLAIALVLDASRSMDEAIGAGTALPGGASPPTKLEAAKDAAETLLASLSPGERAAVLSFADQARLLTPLGADRATQSSALAALVTEPGTRLDRALLAAQAALSARGVAERPVVILLSDGRQEQQPQTVLEAASALEALGIARYAVALGRRADRALLAEIADSGEVLDAGDGLTLERAFSDLLETVRCTESAAWQPEIEQP